MKHILHLVALAFIIVTVASVGCGPAPAPAGTEKEKPEQKPEPEIEIRPAPIHEVKVTTIASALGSSYPPLVLVYIKGGLPDSATTLHDLTIARDGNVITITVTTQRPTGVAAAQVYGYFERNVSLGTNFSPDLTYTVKVNDKTATFVIPKK